jgi:hypothetical protein
MYIVFRLPRGANGQTAGFVLWHIKKEIDDWAQRYGVKYTQKTIKYDHRLAFDDDETYTLFSMTWNPVGSKTIPGLNSWELVNVHGERY